MSKPYLFLFLTGCQFVSLAQSNPTPTPASTWHDPITLEPKPGKTIVSESEPGVRRYTGSVKLQHQGAVIFCDRAIHQLMANSVSATGHVLLVQGDSISIKSDSLFYDGANRQLTSVRHVLFQDGTSVLTATRIEYDLGAGIARYAGKGRLVHGRTILTNPEGSYSTRTRQVITNPPPGAAPTLATIRADNSGQELAYVTVPMQAVSVAANPAYPSAADLKTSRPAGQQAVAARVARQSQSSRLSVVPTSLPGPPGIQPQMVTPTPGLRSDKDLADGTNESKGSPVSYIKRARSSRQSAKILSQPVVGPQAEESDLERLLNRKKQVYQSAY